MMRDINVALTGENISFCLSLKGTLQAEGYTVSHYFDAAKALKCCKRKFYTFCIVTGSLSEQLLSFITKMRQSNRIIIIVVLEENEPTQQNAVQAFKSGADIYQCKPFITQELLHRMKRMVNWTVQPASTFQCDLSVGSLRIQDNTIFTSDGEFGHPLTEREKEVLTMLIHNKNKIVNRNQILMAIWGAEDYFLTRSLDVIICRLRMMLKHDASVMLETIRGIGFRLSDATACERSAASAYVEFTGRINNPAPPLLFQNPVEISSINHLHRPPHPALQKASERGWDHF